MDRISDSGSDDWGSTPHGDTKQLKIFKCPQNPLILLRLLNLSDYTYSANVSMTICAVFLYFKYSDRNRYAVVILPEEDRERKAHGPV